MELGCEKKRKECIILIRFTVGCASVVSLLSLGLLGVCLMEMVSGVRCLSDDLVIRMGAGAYGGREKEGMS